MSFQLNRFANQLDWNLLRTFMVIVQERSITAAAQRLNVTQPSVSAALRRLEQRLAVQLIERGSGRVFQVTPSGEQVYREALEIYGGVVRLERLSEQAEHSISGNIVIYRSSHIDLGFLAPYLNGFRERHPAVTFSITATRCQEVVRAVLQREASLGICTRMERSPRLRRHDLPGQEFGVFCGPRHPLHGQESPDPRLIATSDVVGFEGETMTGSLGQIVRYRARHDIGERMIATTTSIVDLIGMLKKGTAIGCMALLHARDYAGDLWRIPVEAPDLLVEVYSVLDRDRHHTPAERAFVDLLSENGLVAEEVTD